MNHPRNVHCSRALAATGLTAVFVLLAGSSSEMVGQEPKGKFADPERVFHFADTNRDGKLSRDEFEAIMARAGRMKDNPKAGRFLFKRFDANSDGSLSLDEF